MYIKKYDKNLELQTISLDKVLNFKDRTRYTIT